LNVKQKVIGLMVCMWTCVVGSGFIPTHVKCELLKIFRMKSICKIQIRQCCTYEQHSYRTYSMDRSHYIRLDHTYHYFINKVLTIS
jgi:hypothetical protein